MAIEVEKKFILEPEDIDRVISGAEFISEKSFTDTYFDSSDYSLTTADKWLRLREDRFELKLPMNEGKGISRRKLDQYKELETDDAIRAALSLPDSGNLHTDLLNCGYHPFCTFTTTRKKYKKGDFIIDLDDIDFGYRIGEIELMIDDPSEMQTAHNRILSFATDQGLSVVPVRGKVIEFIRRNSPEHYKALKEAGVL